MVGIQLNLLNRRTFSDHETWLSWLHEMLPKPNLPPDAPVILDLFAGCGGLALGFEVEGFHTYGFEMKQQAVATYNTNLCGSCEKKMLSVGMPEGEADVIIGGPPCQPFSQIGYQRGKQDARDGFPIFLDAVNRIQPKIAILENVRGLLYRNKDYLRQTIAELERFGYNVDTKLFKALEYGVPQKRERVVIVASRVGWLWPEAFTTQAVTAGLALGSSALHFDSDSRFLTPNMDRYVAAYEKKSQCVRPRDLHLDTPSRTVTCRNLGGATADMLRIRLPDGRRRMLTVRESARLQGFPDWFEFQGTSYEQYEQIGNAVAPLMSLALAKQVKLFLESPTHRTSITKQKLCNTEQQQLVTTDPIATKKEQALNIIRNIGIPVRDMTPRRRERVVLALLAVARLKPEMPWSQARSYFDNGPTPMTTREVIRFWNTHYGETTADSSYDDVRRKDLIYLVEAGLIEKSAANPTADTNDGTRGYAVNQDGLQLLRAYGSDDWEAALLNFRDRMGILADRLSKAREFKMVPVTLPNRQIIKLSPGPHNRIQKAVIEQFLPRFANKTIELLYLGDTEKKILFIDNNKIKALGLSKLERNMLPDILAYEENRNWLFMIEAVHSSNPINQLRHMKLRELTDSCTAGIVYVSAFENMKMFAKFSKEISWETEVWVADNPDHMIHFDGERFLGPYT
ncbi:BsuBI/PstI family type II restriction endonuclease [Lusitaniella coriacea]|uniref:BsuBI/PstI family type II restriction endonuclease n=1 Tax=Lusitaniella coriacea TaxID=1983105 RepID=UPI003CE70452